MLLLCCKVNILLQDLHLYLCIDCILFFLVPYFTASLPHFAHFAACCLLIFSFLSIFFIAIILYCTVRMFEIRAKQHKHLKQEIAEYAHHQALQEREFREKEEISANERWIKVLNYLSSTNESDWKLAVIEADTMLEELMTQLGFKGENLGDKLKGADRENFRSLSSAWEVHIIRNKIAHEGASFNFSLREAKRVIALYEQIFREYGFI